MIKQTAKCKDRHTGFYMFNERHNNEVIAEADPDTSGDNDSNQRHYRRQKFPFYLQVSVDHKETGINNGDLHDQKHQLPKQDLSIYIQRQVRIVRHVEVCFEQHVSNPEKNVSLQGGHSSK